MTYNVLRATGALTSACHAKATTATLRTHLIHDPAPNIARSARCVTLHLSTTGPGSRHGPPNRSACCKVCGRSRGVFVWS